MGCFDTVFKALHHLNDFPVQYALIVLAAIGENHSVIKKDLVAAGLVWLALIVMNVGRSVGRIVVALGSSSRPRRIAPAVDADGRWRCSQRIMLALAQRRPTVSDPSRCLSGHRRPRHLIRSHFLVSAYFTILFGDRPTQMTRKISTPWPVRCPAHARPR